MRSNTAFRIATIVVAAALSLPAAGAFAKGCLKGAAAGAIAGHVAGHHAVLGAVGGCIVGHHLAKQHAKPPVAAPAPVQATTR